MREIRLSYSDLQNAGDLFSKECVERLSRCKIVRSKVYNADMLAIGGALFGAQYSNTLIRRAFQIGLSVIYGQKPLHVWGSGFLYRDNPNEFYRKNLIIHALRGRKTQEKLQKITGETYNAVLADPGLLIDILLDEKPKKKYEVGIIPHFSQQTEAVFQHLADQYSTSSMIDICRSPMEVIREISKCELILSSSLHGLVFADSMHIPSVHVLGSKALSGGQFKFEDYYSAYGLEDNAWNLGKGFPSRNDIINSQRINITDVEDKKKRLIDVFPYCL
jgi:pyruvyltransferase